MTLGIAQEPNLDDSADAVAICWQSMRSLSERIRRANSSTLELEQWCRERGIGDGRVTARCNRSASRRLLDQDSLNALMDFAGENIAHRCVQLVTAGTVLVDADNWYFIDRLTRNMQRKLEATDISFGRVIAGLRPRRRTFLVKLCTLAELEAVHEHREFHAWESDSIRPDHVFEHRALVHLPDGRPLAVVHERYRATLLSEHFVPVSGRR